MIGDRSLYVLDNFFSSPNIVESYDDRIEGIMSFRCVEYEKRSIFNISKSTPLYDGYIEKRTVVKNASTFMSALRHCRLTSMLTEINVKGDVYYIACGIILNQEYKPLVLYTSEVTTCLYPILYVSPRLFDNNTKVIEKGIMKFLPEYCAMHNISFIISRDIDNYIKHTKVPIVKNFSDCIWEQIKSDKGLYEGCKDADISQLT